MQANKQRIYRVLQLVGSPTSDFYRELSEVYARGCIAALEPTRNYTFVIAYVTPDGLWRFPESLHPEAITAAPTMALSQALAIVASAQIEIALPQMFCLAGMTHYRAILEIMNIPYLGNRPAQMAITADKAKTKGIVAAAGVPVPQGQLLRRGETPSLALPVVVKPNASDNSDGVVLVEAPEDYQTALEDAFSYSETVIVEEYITLGREVRCGIVVQQGQLVGLPLEEYFVDPLTRPIRTRVDKLKRSKGDALTLAAKAASESWIVHADDPIVAPVIAMAKRCHRAIGCEQYSLFDFRIDPQGNPWFLEAGLYCSFSPQSVIATMMSAAGTSLDDFFYQAITEIVDAKDRLVECP